MASSRLTMLISAVKVGYNYAPETVTATWRENQELVYKNETDLFSKLNAQEPRRMTLAALNLELEKPVEPNKDNGTGEFGFQGSAGMDRGYDETTTRPNKRADIILALSHRSPRNARSRRSDQGVNDDRSPFQFAQQSVAYGLVPSDEAQLAQAPAYQRARTAAAEELLARN
ncbi:hypothetical protein MMC31_007039, partial [Peltigera leucophlebia]|nr:hypothetical protein [Peltigera leucophlebia]